MKQLLWLGAVWPLVFFPFLADPTPVGVRGTGTYATESDTTYADGRYAALVPGVTDTITQGANTMIRFIPDPDSIGVGVPYRAIREPGGDDYLVLSYDTLVTAALDSSQVDSIWSAWGMGTPLAYAVDVPQQPGQGNLAGGGLGTIFGLTIQDSSDLASLVGYAYLDSGPFVRYSRIAEYDSFFTNWSDYWYADFIGDSAGMAAWHYIANSNVDSAGANKCYHILNYHDYYDRIYSHFSYWWRTADTSYVRKAEDYADVYRSCLNSARRAPRDWIPDGLVMSWIMSKDTLDLKPLTKESAYLEQYFARRQYWGAATDCESCDDARIQSRVFLGSVLAEAFDFPDTAAWSPGWDSAYTYAADSMWQWIHVGSDSAYQSGFFPIYAYCDGMVGWQMGTQFSHAMIRDQEFLATAARSDSIDSLIVRLADTLMASWINVDPVGKASEDSFNFLYVTDMDTSHARVTLKHSDVDSTAAWWWRYYDAGHTKAPTAGVAVDSFWQKHIYLRDTGNGGHDSVAVDGRQYDLSCHFGDAVQAHSVFSGHVTEPYQPTPYLDGMIAPIYARAWRITGDSSYWYMADSLIQGLLYGADKSKAAWMYSNGKLYNEAYYQTQRAIKWMDEGE